MTEQSTSTTPIDRVLDNLNADAAFGQPTRAGDVTVIPVAEVSLALGHGHQVGHGAPGILAVSVQEVNFGGSGYSVKRGSEETVESATETSETEESTATSSGVRGRVKPRGYVQITPDGVAFQDILDITRMGLAGIAFSAWAVYWITKTVRTVSAPAKKEKR